MTARARVRAKTHRLIASRYPTIGVFDDLTNNPDEIAMGYLLESATNDRLAVVSRRLPYLPPAEIVHGPGATMVMAAFLHASDGGGRFTDARLGAWYASFNATTAIAETLYHNTRRLRWSANAFPCAIQMRELTAKVDCELVDIRTKRDKKLYDPDDYTHSQAFGVSLRWPKKGQPENGVVYRSVRHNGGENVCVYRPSLIQLPVVQADHYEYRYDAKGTATVLKLTNVTI